MLEMRIQVQSSETLRRLRKFAAAMSPEQRTLNNRKSAIQLHADVVRTFAAQGATEGRRKWAPLKLGGRWKGKGKSRRFQTAYQLLADTGALRASYIPLHDDVAAGVGAASIKGHSDLAPLHQYGNPAKNLPARPMLPTEGRAIGVVTQVYGLAIERAAQP